MTNDLPSAENVAQESGMVQRGLLLLGLMTALAAVVIIIIVQRPSNPPPTSSAPAQLSVPLALVGPFPAALPWGQLAFLNSRLPSAPGWEIRYNAALALARRGSAETPWPIIQEMLDEEQQYRNFVTLQNGKLTSDEEAALRTVYSTLGVLAEWHKRRDTRPATSDSAPYQLVLAEVDRLASHSNTQLRVQADRVRTLLRK